MKKIVWKNTQTTLSRRLENKINEFIFLFNFFAKRATETVNN